MALNRRTEISALTIEQCRAFDARAMGQCGIPGIVLMENAGRGCVDSLERFAPADTGPVLILCGKGNNAGDGLVMLRHLILRGRQADALMLCGADELRGDAGQNWRIAENCGLPTHDASDWPLPRLETQLADAAWIVDAVLGIGARGPLRNPLAELLDAVNRLPARKLAVDVPTGLNPDTGEADPHTFVADLTCTMVAPKVGFQSPAAKQVLGTVEVVDIGAP